jgi:diguanylate cyclase
MMADARSAPMIEPVAQAELLYGRIGGFLTDHRLPPSPANYAFAYQLFTQPDGPLARAVAERVDGGIRLAQADVDTLTGTRSDEHAIEQQIAASQSLVARTAAQVEGFETMVRALRTETGNFGDDLAAGADALRRDGSTIGIAAVVDMAGAMVDRVRTAERRLEAATTEASELRQKLQEARDNARRDPLTGLPNRRALEESYATAIAGGEAVCLAVCDVDNFKAFNDRFGHLIGDRVLKAIADVLADRCAGHLVARFGGEEFAVLFSGLSLDQAIELLDDARITVAAKRYRLRESGAPLGDIAFSAGLTAAAPAETLATLFERADRLLYAAKADGRNCLKAG